MALWGTFKWSDGTLWADAYGTSQSYTSFIDRSGYRISMRITQTNQTWPGSLSSFVLQAVAAELGIRPQLPQSFQAFIDRNENTQRISVRVTHTAGEEIDILTESGEVLQTEGGDDIILDPPTPFNIDKIHGLILPRSRRQPTG